MHARWDINNKMERFNGTVRDFLRGMQEDYWPLLEGFRVYNHVRPREGICEMTPGEAAGIAVNGPKRKTLIQHAMRFRKKYGWNRSCSGLALPARPRVF